MLNIEKLKQAYPEDWVKQISELWKEQRDKPINYSFFKKPGDYNSRSTKAKIPLEFRSHFDHILYSPNYAILSYILDNKDKFKNTVNIDTGCGLGLLSIFLDKIGINCLNYDNYSQLEKGHTNLRYSNIANGLIDSYNSSFNRSTSPVLNTIDEKIDVVICSGCAKIEHPKLINASMYLVDCSYIDHPHVSINFKDDYEELCDYPTLIKVYRRK